MRQFIVILTVFLCLVFSGSSLLAADKPTVFVSIMPQKFFVEQIAGDLVDVEVMVKPGASPATYEPKVSQMKKLALSAVYFSIGVPFEQAWLKRIAGVNSQMRIVATDMGIQKIPMAKHLHDHGEHAHEKEHASHEEAQEGGLDPHIWLSPKLVKLQAATIAASLEELLPANREIIIKNLVSFTGRVEQLDRELEEILKEKEGLRFMVFHPSWGYFAKDYGLVQTPIESEGKGPKSSQLRELIHMARQQDIRVIFAQPQFSTKSAGLIAREIKGQVITVDPLAKNWFSNIRGVAEKFRDALQ